MFSCCGVPGEQWFDQSSNPLFGIAVDKNTHGIKKEQETENGNIFYPVETEFPAMVSVTRDQFD